MASSTNGQEKRKITRRRFLKYAVLSLAALGLGGGLHLRSDKFGSAPAGERLARVLASPNYHDGQFRNYEPFLPPDPQYKNAFWPSMKRFLLPDKGDNIPAEPIPAVKTDFHALPRTKNAVCWLGHSTVYFQLDGLRMLLDPVFTRYAAPVPGIIRAFNGTEIYTPADIPDLDVLLLTHDHWDHLDYGTVSALHPRTKQLICPLGVGAHLEQWGVPAAKITELDWYDSCTPATGLRVTLTPTRHFSGRLLKRNQTLWGGFALELAHRRVFISGDGGYGKHFKEIGARFGGFDLALMECGQYNMAWHNVHLLPEETAQAAADIRAKKVIPMHAGKYCISYHQWRDPYERLSRAAKKHQNHWQLLTPRLGEQVEPDLSTAFPAWWEGRQ